MMRVHDPGRLLGAAVAELPASARPGGGPEDAIVAVDGRGDWIAPARAALAAGAAGLVVLAPTVAPAAQVRSLAAAGAPVTLVRALLRTGTADAVADAVRANPARIVTADLASGAALRGEALRDGLGWLRALAGPLAVVGGSADLALLESQDGTPATLLAAVTDSPRWPGRIRARALGEVVIEVDAEADRIRHRHSGAEGTLLAPPDYESPVRAALRRVIRAVGDGIRPADLADLADDAELAEILEGNGIDEADPRHR